MSYPANTVQEQRHPDYTYTQLSRSDVPILKELLAVFGDAFGDAATYRSAVPDDAYLQNLLSREHFIVLVAAHNNVVVGGLAAYELEKFEQARREIYIYDLAVSERHRRQGIARNLIQELRKRAVDRKAYVIYVQADQADEAAVRLYESLGTRQDVYHFDIAVPGT